MWDIISGAPPQNATTFGVTGSGASTGAASTPTAKSSGFLGDVTNTAINNPVAKAVEHVGI